MHHIFLLTIGFIFDRLVHRSCVIATQQCGECSGIAYQHPVAVNSAVADKYTAADRNTVTHQNAVADKNSRGQKDISSPHRASIADEDVGEKSHPGRKM